ncbi:16S rRNA (guanine(527)-N(7))-methyltransferase RsmG [Egbenema bharatensis]|uniref:16S rRNA (guanine(527)-N(7))-methyltransferase RsmG n=1 Tax=Egbenema bharatensis TaxID=3463334 RepID=UPI003A89477E
MSDEGLILPPMMGQWQHSLGWQPTPVQQQQFQQLYELILGGNRQLNLTRITDPTEFWEKHLWDSLSGVRGAIGNGQWGMGNGEPGGEGQEAGTPGLQNAISPHSSPLTPHPSPLTPHSRLPTPDSRLLTPNSFQVIDIGTGAGFPGIPVAIACPDWTVTLLDSTRKKMAFLDTVLETMGILNAKTLVDRVEQVGQQPQHRASYDLALIRAVAAASVCAEYALPLLKVGGVAVLYRGQWTPEEESQLKRSVSQLGGSLAAVDRLTLPLSQGIRHCVMLKKLKPTPGQFPRAVGIPVQKPI